METLVVSKALAIIYLRLEVTRVGLVVEDEVEKWMVVRGQGGGFERMRAHWPWPGVGKASPPRGSGIRLKRWNLSPPSPQARISSHV